MKKTRRLLAILLALLFTLPILASCNGGGNGDSSSPATDSSPSQDAPVVSDAPPSDSADAPPDPGSGANADRTLNIAASQDSGTLYPLGVTGGFVGILYCLYEPLYDTMADGSRKWVLATALDRVTDLQYTLKIREGVNFSNGNPLTAEDVMFSMELCRDNPQFNLNVKVVDFEKTKVTDDFTIDLHYTEFNASQEPGFASMFVIDKESFDEVSLSRNPIGTGPYTVSDYVVNNHLSVTARDDYWGEPAKIKNIEFKVINEDSQIINALETHDVDMSLIQISDADFVKDTLGYDVTISNAGYNYITLFSMQPGNPLESKEARWAVSHAINREDIAELLFKGRSEITDYPASEAMYDFEPRFADINETYSIGYDPQRATELAEQTGLIGKTLRIITNGSSPYNTIAEIVQANLIDIGINADIINYDQATYFPMMMDANNFEIAIFNPSAPSMLAVDVLAMYLTFIPLGWEGPDRDRYGELSQSAISTADPAERSDKLFEAIKYFVDFDPWYGLCEVVMARAQSPDVGGVNYTPAGSIYYNEIFFK
ncbi:MAG: ABC transporter substrate-binding protein [Oscillospiraceae bacterium]|jgi:peptide/nickel transport system substrate-binding protein|nr:ABC transporter substrate-binding protein [Oscillospiraceae bacterium]